MRVGFIGLGIMGSRQAANLVRAGHELRVFNRTRETAEAWASEHKAEVADSPRAAAEGADAVITMVVDGAQVEAMLLGEDGAVAGAPDGTLFIDCSTIAPADARRLGETLREQGHGLVDAPVTGSAPKAEDGTLTIMAGGSDEDMQRAMPLLEAMGEADRPLRRGRPGPGGQGDLQLRQRDQLRHDRAGARRRPARRGRPRVARRGHGRRVGGLDDARAQGPPDARPRLLPLFKLEHMLKDVGLCLDEARTAGAPFLFAALARELYGAGVGRGLGEQDFAAVLEVVEDLGGAKV